MLSLRRIASMLTMLVMLHLALVGGDAACAEHGEHRAMARMSEAAAHDAAASHEAHHASDRAPCEAPATAHCCDALASCAMVALGAPVGTSVSIVVGAVAPPAASRALLSRASGPEPPPPRA